MNCKNMKIRTKKGTKYIYCSLLKKEITYDMCNHCENKEYKKQKSIIFSKNNANWEKKSPKMCKKSSKITKLERNRKSVFTNDLTKSIMCGKPKHNLHEIFMGRNRQNSMKYGFVIPVCIEHHRICHNNSQIQEFWHEKGQLYFEKNIGSREEFISIFGINYLKEKS